MTKQPHIFTPAHDSEARFDDRAAYERHLAREKVISQMLGALSEAELQIEYLHERWQPTGTGNALLERIRAAIAAAEAAGIKVQP